MLKQRADSSCSNGLYVAPKMGDSIDSLQPLPISWDPSCLSSSNEIDIYLYSPNSALPRIHVWQHIATSRATYSAQLMPRWWNATSSQQLQIIIVPTGNPPFTSTFPAGPVFNATYAAPSSGQIPAAADTTQIDSGITVVNDVAKANEKVASGKRAAAGVLVPFFLILIAVAVYVKFKRNKQHAKRRAWTEKVDTRMSTISTDWKSVSAAGAHAAIRHSMATNNRASSYSFGAPRPLSELNNTDDGGGGGMEDVGNDDGRPKMRTGTGVGLRNPNTLSQAGSTGDRFSRGVSRVSFAEQSRPSIESRRSNAPTRPFHNAHVPPVPALPGVDNSSRDQLSPKQTAGALSLTPEDIKARIAAASTGKLTKSSSVSAFDEVLPALSLMRTGNDPTHPNDEDGDFLLLPTPPEPSHAKPTALKKSSNPASAITTVTTTTSLFPMPPNQQQPQGTAAAAAVLSPDEMLRAYAERKKSLAAAAAAGRIGAAPIRVSASASSLSNSNPVAAVSSLRGGGGGGRSTPVQTVGSIHDTGMRVAYHSDVARVSLKLSSPAVPPSPSLSSRNSMALSNAPSSKRKSSLFSNPFASSNNNTTAMAPAITSPSALPNSVEEESEFDRRQHAKSSKLRAVSLAKMVDDELARVEAEAEAANDDNNPYPYAFSSGAAAAADDDDDPSMAMAAAYAYAYDEHDHEGAAVVQAVGEGVGGGEEGQDVGVAGRGAFGYRY